MLARVLMSAEEGDQRASIVANVAAPSLQQQRFLRRKIGPEVNRAMQQPLLCFAPYVLRALQSRIRAVGIN